MIQVSDRTIMRLAKFGIWCLPILTFTTPGRPSPSSLAFLDGLALIKLLVLLVVFFGGGLALVSKARQEPAVLRTIRPLLPFFLFFAWALLTVLWTPLPAVSIGQAGGIASLLVLACLVGLVAQDKAGLETILKSVSWSLLAFSLFVLTVHVLAPNYSGLDRRMLVHGSDGVIHPTAAGANSSLGLLLAACCYFITRYRWAMSLALASVAINGAVLFYASSRTALGMAVLTVPIVFFWYSGNVTRALVVLGVGLLAIATLLFDPGFGLVTDSDSAGVKYITRGQSGEQLKGMSGRYEMWSKIWNEYRKSPIIGHGYFVTSETGAVEVWYMKANHTAHNIYLQVAVSTGVIGLILFLIAIGRLVCQFLSLFGRDALARQVASMLVFVFIWYLGWSTLCASFMGPVRSESMFFFAFLGLGVGQLARFSSSAANRRTHPAIP
jgi:O-antigen ligase